MCDDAGIQIAMLLGMAIGFLLCLPWVGFYRSDRNWWKTELEKQRDFWKGRADYWWLETFRHR